ncbi:MAG TPA: bifunctional diaminohydroxyphosphoribosylaminopyrimidine deaminase/5-amino-6-(5-phosphoribosylamino)uracil reductase RibD [Thiomonas arsenitoxydans]|uniref:bifunctional diaminohydroxyphosphoribosylaminopyrimidine deaminase/5-amino-6-(5-phosphoribosylamino)uracil reductase RibD n=1 Tax=Thiomonas TaxID=32012 RepID=UPI002580379F|nr:MULTISPECIES: bifunctional diaminohydroxyphosphoribosylaminopyrimidine deaminase/5-amino-6-(5-phosphoribosylamino)uracil reductase RibD [Thiomonas]HML80860.1 bifunctional diaminohydroxyphosphoribosylaminopyrimidine deaminase/5-amino-6-(5-phosphoribosylamino)uracil reductase RibD [Thiomonas arsenitoxydans]
MNPDDVSFSEQDQRFMRRALDLAHSAMYRTSPNPRVGCVLVRDGQVLGEGATLAAGQDHAEVQAVKQAWERGHEVRGATAYVTLEPCAHHGRTPPCADLLATQGVARVVAALVDPNPLVAGQGLQRLRDAGIQVDVGLFADEAREINLCFISRMVRGTPWVRLKVAASLDGVTALPNGASQWITSEAARADGHHWRARACAVLTGLGTVRADDPQLNVRAVQTPRQPIRIVIDSRLECPPTARLLQSAESPLWIVHALPPEQAAPRLAALRSAATASLDLQDIALPNDPGKPGKTDLRALMQVLGQRGINELHCEAGEKLNGSLLRAGVVDELLLYLAPQLLGEGAGLAALGPYQQINEGLALRWHDVQRIGADLRILARLPHSFSL